ncbi:MAG TPA: transposase [Acidobacteriota bacterium]|nr:transposase [Acidobacteriota bacterium]
MNDARVAAKVRVQIRRFSGKLSEELPKTARRMVGEVLHGIQSRGSVLLSEIARSLAEPVSLKKRIERLSRQLDRRGLDRALSRSLLQEAGGKLDDEALLVVDPTDIVKPHGRRMPYLAQVRDGSEGELREGYWCCLAVAAWRGRAEVVPLYQELYSQEAPCFVSENEQILRAVRRVRRHAGKKGTWVMDRGGDRIKLLKPLLQEKIPFLIRMRGDRAVYFARRRMIMERVAEQCPLRFRETVVKETDKGERIYQLDIGSRKVRLPGFERKLTLVVVRGFGQRPLMLLTTLEVTRSRKSHWRVVQAYLSRWRVEETIRFIKQSYQLEDIRLLSYRRLRSMAVLVMAAAYFACAYLGRDIRLNLLLHRVYRAAKRVYGIPEFRFYAIADGMKNILFTRHWRTVPATGSDPPLNAALPFDS